MTRFSRLFVTAVAASLIASPIPAQRSGGDGGGGVLGGVGGLVGNTLGRAGGALGSVGNTLGNTVGSLGYSVGGLTNPLTGGLGSGGFLGTRTNSVANSSLYNFFARGSGMFGDAAALDQVGYPDSIDDASPTEIESFREARLAALIAANRAILDRDPKGEPVRRYELIATNPDAISLALALRGGFRLIGDEREGNLGIRLVTLAIPKGMNVRQAMKDIHRAAPGLQVDFNHVYEPSGGALRPARRAKLASARPIHAATRIAMIDGGVASHPSLARASIVQQGFAGNPEPTGHGTAVSSLLVGEQGPFHGAARGAQLFVADVYGGNPAAGSVTSILRALDWAASKNPSVINISLVGPDNAALARAIAAVRARGIQVVAAVGNDGPAAPPEYPASYPGVVSVTAVDAHGRALPEAGRAGHLDFAAPGADMIAAFPGNGYTVVRGTSFASPLAAARLALTGSYQRLAMEAQPGQGRIGRGIVCAQCRVDPVYIRRK